MADPVNHPKHYTSHPSGVEAIEVCQHLNFCIGNAVKYLFRAGKKDPVLQDLQKAAWYLRHFQTLHRMEDSIFTPYRSVEKVLNAEPDGSVLKDVLTYLVNENDCIALALARVEREIERVQEGR